jgi:sarcosine oxidase subunit beta
MSKPAVCIIGAGVMGLSTALQLTERGITDVTVIDSHYPASGSSGLSVGVVETQYVDPFDIELRARAMTHFRRLEHDHDLHVSRIGYLRLSHGADTTAAFEDSVRTQQELGITDACVLDQQQIGNLVPDLDTTDVESALYGPDDGFIDGHRYCGLMAELAQAGGARLVTRSRVEGATAHAQGGYTLATNRGEYDADFIVNAAGAWGGQVADMLGVSMPLAPQRHQAIMLHLPEPLSYTMPMVMDYTPHSGELGVYFRHERPGQLMCGLHSEEAIEEVADVNAFARSADLAFVEAVAEALSKRLPSMQEAGLAHGWAGLYPVSIDGLPQVGPYAAAPAVIAANGAGGSGIQLSPIIGELVCDWIEYGEARAIAGAKRLLPDRASLSI